MILNILSTLSYVFGNSIDILNLSVIWLEVLIFTVILCFVTGELTNNLSQVDKIWSIMPIIYSFITLNTYPYSPRIILMTTLVTFWGLRLSYNFYRKGGYNIIPWKGEEDYRWGILRKNTFLNSRFKMMIFNLVFISFYQQFLILLFTTPLLLAAQFVDKRIGVLDIIAGFLMFLFIIIETIADNQLYDFHLQKKNLKHRTGKFESSLNKGFMTDGLWKFVRHPNFAAEQAIWISFYLFGVSASDTWFNWTISGPVLLILLFAGSSEFTEKISKSKYPDYESYIKLKPKFVPINFNFKNNDNAPI